MFITINNTHYTIAHCKCNKYEISTNYIFSLTLISENELDIYAIIGNKSTLNVDKRTLYGIITKVISNNKYFSNNTYYVYKITFESILSLLNIKKQTRSFLSYDILEIIKLIFSQYDINYKLILNIRNYKKHKLSIQYNETDYDFLLRKLSYYGLFITFKDTRIEIRDYLSDIGTTNTSLYFDSSHKNNTKTRTYWNLLSRTKIVHENLELHRYNYEKPYNMMLIKKNYNYLYTNRIYGEIYNSFEDGDRLITNWQNSINIRKQLITLYSNTNDIFPGDIVILNNYPIETYNKKYLVINKINNKLTLLENYKNYKNIQIKYKRYTGFTTAKILDLDKNGLYTIQLTLKNKQINCYPVRMATNSVGSDQNHNFYLSNGAVVIIGFEHDNIELPIIIGTLERHNNHKTNSNNFNLLCGNKSKNNIYINDNKQTFYISSQHTTIKMSKNILQYNSESINLEALKNIIYTAKQEHKTISKNNLKIDINNLAKFNSKNYLLYSGNKTIIQSNKNILLDSNKITISTNNSTNITTQFTELNSNKNIDIKSNYDSIFIKAHDINIKAHNLIKIEQANAKIEIRKTGEITIKGKNIYINSIFNNINSIPIDFS